MFIDKLWQQPVILPEPHVIPPYVGSPGLPLAVEEGIAAAMTLLNRPDCAALFGVINQDNNLSPQDFLRKYSDPNNNLLRVGTTYFDGVSQRTFAGEGVGAVTTGERGAYTNSNGVRVSSPVIVINRDGFFFSGTVGGTPVTSIQHSGFWGVASISEVRGLVIIHELLHAAGKIPSDDPNNPNNPPGQSQNNSQMIKEACLD